MCPPPPASSRSLSFVVLVARGGLVSAAVGMSAEAMVNATLDFMSEGELLYIATDEEHAEFFAPFRERWADQNRRAAVPTCRPTDRMCDFYTDSPTCSFTEFPHVCFSRLFENGGLTKTDVLYLTGMLTDIRTDQFAEFPTYRTINRPICRISSRPFFSPFLERWSDQTDVRTDLPTDAYAVQLTEIPT